MNSLADRLRTARLRLSWSQQELARRAGVATSTVGNIESGTRHNPRFILQLAEALGVDAQWLATGRDQRPSSALSTGAGSAPLLAREAGAGPWPFELIDRERFERLTPVQRGVVEAAMLEALERLESVQAKRAAAAEPKATTPRSESGELAPIGR